MEFRNIKYILTDIEGTTTSVKFVYEELFPYFLQNIEKLEEVKSNETVQEAFKATVHLANKLENHRIKSVREIISTLKRWCEEDKKITPLKTVQGIIWEKGYRNGDIKGHVYSDVPQKLEDWTTQNIQLGVFSSGSVAAQKLLFGHSLFGDLTVFFQNYFDTTTGGKRELETYRKIAEDIDIHATNILFLSDIREELEAAELAGMQTCQLVRPGTELNWKMNVPSFEEIILM
jgi:enolase-phosphatase E1